MKTLLFILLIVCLTVQIPVWIIYFIHKKKIDKMADDEMKKIYPTWPYVPRQKTDFASFPLNMWNDD